MKLNFYVRGEQKKKKTLTCTFVYYFPSPKIVFYFFGQHIARLLGNILDSILDRILDWYFRTA